MIDRELFRKILRRRDEEFSRLCRITSLLEDLFVTEDGKIPNTDGVFTSLDFWSDVLTEAFSAPEGLIQVSLGLEDPEDTDMEELEGTLPDGTVVLIHDYGELYDYLIERGEQVENHN